MNHDFLSSGSDFVWLRLWAEPTPGFSIFALSRPDVIATWNPDGERIQGYRPDEIVGQPPALLCPPESRALDASETTLHVAAQTGRYVEEKWHIRKNDMPFWANVVMTALRDGNNALTGFGTVIGDMSDKKATHDAAPRSERNFRLLVQGVADYAIFMLLIDGHITSWNAGAQRIKGYTKTEIIGPYLSCFYMPEDIAIGVPSWGLETARCDRRFETEGWCARCDESRFFVRIIIDAIYEDGELVGLAKVTHDITGRRRVDEQLEQM